MKVLVVKPTALGDVAQALLVVPQLKRSGFCQQLDWLVDEDYAPLVESCPEVDEIISFPRARWRRTPRLDQMFFWFRDLAGRGYDLTLDLQGLARSGIMTRMTHANRRVGLSSAREFASFAYTEMVEDYASHAVDRYQQAIEHCIGKPALIEPIHAQEKIETHPELRGQTYTVLHPYSQHERKMWPWQNFEKLVEAMPEEKFVLIGRGDFFPLLSDRVVDLRNRTDLKSLLEVIAHAKAVVSTDSGPAHMGVALGVPVVGIFGATAPERTAPRGDQVEILSRSPDVSDYGKRRVLNSVEAAERMAAISIEEVRDALDRLLQSAGNQEPDHARHAGV
ncbi:MAG: glycosyltransferase family 9 protein [Verrucomicrobiota bacterium]